MNLVLLDEHIKLIGVQEDFTTVDFQDDIGFSTADLVSGFNYSDAAAPFEDSNTNPYPVPEDTVAYLFASHIPFTAEEDVDGAGTALTVTRTSTEILAAVNEADGAAPGFDYGTVMNNWSVNAPDDGWLQIRMFIVDVDAPGELYYYNSATGELISSATSEAVEPSSVIDLVPTVSADLLKTSKLDYNIANIISKHTMDLIRGVCYDKDTWRKHIAFLQQGRTAAKVQFDTFGNTWNAAFIIEELERYILVNDLEVE